MVRTRAGNGRGQIDSPGCPCHTDRQFAARNMRAIVVTGGPIPKELVVMVCDKPD